MYICIYYSYTNNISFVIRYELQVTRISPIYSNIVVTSKAIIIREYHNFLYSRLLFDLYNTDTFNYCFIIQLIHGIGSQRINIKISLDKPWLIQRCLLYPRGMTHRVNNLTHHIQLQLYSYQKLTLIWQALACYIASQILLYEYTYHYI